MNSFNDPKRILSDSTLVDNFLQLVAFDTQSDENSKSFPSTEKQFVGLRWLEGRFAKLGLTDIALDEHGYLFATLPGNVEGAPVIGLLAHIDTSPDYSGKDVKPQLHENYQGGPISLNAGIVIDPSDNPQLTQCIGDTIITADGTTLLGADDKAGIAEIMATIELLVANPDIKRPTIRVAITPDEEIGQGVAHFDIKRFGADLAYTLDGGWLGEINGETFSADSATVTISGVAVHPGYAKGKLVNALRWAAKFMEYLPVSETPETTEKYEGYYHPHRIEGSATEVTLKFLLRDFSNEGLQARAAMLEKVKETLLAEEPRLTVNVEISNSYRNMAYWLKDRPEIMANLKRAVEAAGVEPQIKPVRGGTDGSGLTAMGLPTPNIFAGGLNFHGPREWVSTRVMALAVCTTLNLVQIWGESA